MLDKLIAVNSIFLKGECSSSSPSFVGTPFTQWREILPENTRDSKLSYDESLKSLSHLGLNRYWIMTDRQTVSE